MGFSYGQAEGVRSAVAHLVAGPVLDNCAAAILDNVGNLAIVVIVGRCRPKPGTQHRQNSASYTWRLALDAFLWDLLRAAAARGGLRSHGTRAEEGSRMARRALRECNTG